MKNQYYRNDLQGLRAIAIILVVLAHLEISLFKGGFIGVDVFFVLSGYLITGLLLKELQTTQSINFMRFYARRLKRLLPSLLLMLIVTFCILTFLISPYELISKTKSVLYASTWTSNLYFAFAKIDYFSEMELQDFFLHTWSLGVEEQFYLVWPLFIFLCHMTLKHLFKGISPKTKLLSIFIVATCSSFLLALYWSYNQGLWAFYLMPTRIWQFALGGMVFVSFEWDRQGQKNNKYPLFLNRIPAQYIGLLLIVFSGILLSPDTNYPGWWALFPSIGTVLVLTRTQYSASQILMNPALTWVGDRSYSWYLWHWPIILIAQTYGLGNDIPENIWILIISLLVASISYKYVELPFWKGKFSNFSISRSVVTSSLAVAISLTIIITIVSSQQLKVKIEPPNKLNTSSLDAPIIYSKKECDTYYESSDLVPCSYNDKDYSKTIVLMGDSILMQWFSLFQIIFNSPEWRIIAFTKSGCPMVDEDYYNGNTKGEFKVCSKWRKSLLEEIPKIKPDIIILGSSINYPFTQTQWENGSTRIYSKLISHTKNILVVPGTPALSFNGPSCLMKIHNDISDKYIQTFQRQCSKDVDQLHTNSNKKHLLYAANQFNNIQLFKINELVCPEGKCSAINDEGIVVFRDSQHVTDTFARYSAPTAKTLLKKLKINLNE